MGRAWMLHLLMVVLTTLGIGIDAIPVPLLVASSETEWDDSPASDSEDGRDEAPDGLDDLALPRLGGLPRGGLARHFVESLDPDGTGRTTGVRPARLVLSHSLDLPTRLCRLAC